MMLRWDFSYIESRRRESETHGYNRSHLSTAVAPDERILRRRPRSRWLPWVCLAVMALCLWALWMVVVEGVAG